MAVQKQTRPTPYVSESAYDFGEPDIVEITVSNGVVLRFREPDVDDLLTLTEIEKESAGNEILQTIRTICVLHTPDEHQSKITLRDAKKLRVGDLKKIGDAIKKLISFEELGGEELDNKSD
jgi:hypothetical protein